MPFMNWLASYVVNVFVIFHTEQPQYYAGPSFVSVPLKLPVRSSLERTSTAWQRQSKHACFFFSVITSRISRRRLRAGKTLSDTTWAWTNASRRSRSPRPTGRTSARGACGRWTRPRSRRWTRRCANGPTRIPWPSRKEWRCQVRILLTLLGKKHSHENDEYTWLRLTFHDLR